MEIERCCLKFHCDGQNYRIFPDKDDAWKNNSWSEENDITDDISTLQENEGQILVIFRFILRTEMNYTL